MSIKSAGAVLLLMSASTAFAQAPAPIPDQPQAAQPAPARPVRLVLDMTIDHQFNKLGTVQYTDGSTVDIGDAIVGLGVGGAVALTQDRQFEVQGLVGFRFARAGASNGDVTFMEFPIEVTGHVNLGKFRLGAGPAVHIGPQVSGSGVASGVKVAYDTAFGAVGAVEYLFGAGTSKISLGLRGTWFSLAAGGQSLDASGLGFLFACYL